MLRTSQYDRQFPKHLTYPIRGSISSLLIQWSKRVYRVETKLLSSHPWWARVCEERHRAYECRERANFFRLSEVLIGLPTWCISRRAGEINLTTFGHDCRESSFLPGSALPYRSVCIRYLLKRLSHRSNLRPLTNAFLPQEDNYGNATLTSLAPCVSWRLTKTQWYLIVVLERARALYNLLNMLHDMREDFGHAL